MSAYPILPTMKMIAGSLENHFRHFSFLFLQRTEELIPTNGTSSQRNSEKKDEHLLSKVGNAHTRIATTATMRMKMPDVRLM